MLDEVFDEAVDPGRVELARLRRQRAFDHRSRAAADQITRGIVGDRRKTFAGEYDVWRGDEIGRAVDPRAGEADNMSPTNPHPTSLPWDARHGEAPFA